MFFFAWNISNIGLGCMKITQLSCVAGWLAGFCMVFTSGFTWYVSDKLLLCSVFYQNFLQEFKDLFSMYILSDILILQIFI